MRLFLLMLLVGVLAACTATTPRYTANTITVEGQISMRGNEPFTTYMLETANQNLYVLTFDDGQEQTFTTAARYRLTGTVSADRWNGRSFAHLRVLDAETF